MPLELSFRNYVKRRFEEWRKETERQEDERELDRGMPVELILSSGKAGNYRLKEIHSDFLLMHFQGMTAEEAVPFDHIARLTFP